MRLAASPSNTSQTMNRTSDHAQDLATRRGQPSSGRWLFGLVDVLPSSCLIVSPIVAAGAVAAYQYGMVGAGYEPAGPG
jgi:hypothetical protein